MAKTYGNTYTHTHARCTILDLDDWECSYFILEYSEDRFYRMINFFDALCSDAHLTSSHKLPVYHFRSFKS